MTCPVCKEQHNLSQCPRWKIPPCEDCAKAIAGLWSGYSATCDSCAARAVARSPCAFEASRSRDNTELRAVLARALPSLPFDQAADLARGWWMHDHRAPEIE